VSFSAWLSLYPMCEPLTYSALLAVSKEQGGDRALPEFIEFDLDLKLFKVRTGNPFAEGVYTIKLQSTNLWTL
jgi:hypothetical protein